MQHLSAFFLVVVLIVSNAIFPSAMEAQPPPRGIPVAEPLEYVRVYADPSGASHFGDGQVDFNLADYSPPAPPISVSDSTPAEGVLFLSSPEGWYGDFHPAPRRQFIFFLSGELEVEVSDGEKRRFGPGSVLVLEDTTGQGHVSRVVGDERAYIAAVPIMDP